MVFKSRGAVSVVGRNVGPGGIFWYGSGRDWNWEKHNAIGWKSQAHTLLAYLTKANLLPNILEKAIWITMDQSKKKVAPIITKQLLELLQNKAISHISAIYQPYVRHMSAMYVKIWGYLRCFSSPFFSDVLEKHLAIATSQTSFRRLLGFTRTGVVPKGIS